MKVGSRNGRLEFLGLSPGDKRRFRVRCDCGAEKTIRFENWRKTQSCGCLMREVNSRQNATHGMTRGNTRGKRRPSEYEIWGCMIQRCRNPNNPNYRNYGGRGISVCERWAADFMAFYADMGPRPSTLYSIDRINNDGNYEPGNCRWVTRREQALNTRRNRRHGAST